MEEYGMKVWLEFQIKNLKDIKKKAEDGLKESNQKIGKSLGESLARAFGSISGTAGKAMSSISRSLGGIGRAGAGVMAGAGAGAMAGLGAAAVGAVVLLKMIHDKVSKGMQKLAEIAPELRGAKETTEKMWNLAMRPITNIMVMLMRPYLQLAMRLMRPKLQEMYSIMRASGGNPSEEQMDEIMEIWSETATILSSVFQNMMSVIKPIGAYLEGFTESIKLVFNNWLDGIKAWIQGFIDGLGGEGLTALPQEMVDAIISMIQNDPTALYSLPTDIAERFKMWLMDNPGKWPQLPDDVRKTIMDWLEASDNDFATKLARNIINFLFVTENQEALKKVLPDFTDQMDSMLNDPGYWQGIKNVLIEFKNNIQKLADEANPKKQSVDIDKLWSNLTWKGWPEGTPRKKQIGANYIDQEGMYYLHKGEKVVNSPRAGKESGRVSISNVFNLSGSNNGAYDIQSVITRSTRLAELELRARGYA